MSRLTMVGWKSALLLGGCALIFCIGYGFINQGEKYSAADIPINSDLNRGEIIAPVQSDNLATSSDLFNSKRAKQQQATDDQVQGVASRKSTPRFRQVSPQNQSKRQAATTRLPKPSKLRNFSAEEVNKQASFTTERDELATNDDQDTSFLDLFRPRNNGNVKDIPINSNLNQAEIRTQVQPDNSSTGFDSSVSDSINQEQQFESQEQSLARAEPTSRLREIRAQTNRTQQADAAQPTQASNLENISIEEVVTQVFFAPGQDATANAQDIDLNLNLNELDLFEANDTIQQLATLSEEGYFSDDFFEIADTFEIESLDRGE